MQKLYEAITSKIEGMGDSISSYPCSNMRCPKDKNGFVQLKCATGDCNSSRKQEFQGNKNLFLYFTSINYEFYFSIYF